MGMQHHRLNRLPHRLANLSRPLRYWILSLVILTTIVACQIPNPLHQSLAPDLDKPLANVAPLPNPTIPNWISEISPKDNADSRSQIRIRFTDPLVPLEALDGPNQQELLRHFEIQPSLPGQFRLLTPHMVGFQADRALPTATRVQVTLKSGLADLANHRLSQDLAWTFTTDRLTLVNLPAIGDNPSEITPVSLKPSLDITANTELDLGSATANLVAGQTKIPLTIAPQKTESDNPDRIAEPDPETKFDPSQKTWAYSLTPNQPLAPATTYQLTIEPGLKPRRGNLPSDAPFNGAIQTYAPLTFKGLSYSGKPDGSGTYGRFQSGAGELTFNNGLNAESALQQIAIDPAPKTDVPALRINDGDRTISLNPWALDPAIDYRITLGKDLRDQFGQSLGKPQTIAYNPGDVAPDLWAPTGLNIFPTGTDLQLNLTAINLPQAQYKASYRVLDPTDLIGLDDQNLDQIPPGKGPLLPDVKTWETIAIPSSQRNQVSEIAVPIAAKLRGKSSPSSSSTTGLLAYGITGKTYSYEDGDKTLQREPKFQGLVQLTNLGVFSQWFPDSGLVRVHHLSDGAAVANAAIDIYQSPIQSDSNTKSAPSKPPCAQGRTDATGLLQLDAAALKTCMAIDGPKEQFTEAPQLLTVVREGNDWAYSRSRPWSGSYGYGIYAGWTDRTEARGEIFSDRKLYKPGETAWFTGVAVQLDRGKLRQDKEKAYQITVINPNGDRSDLGQQTTTPFGTFSLEWPIGSDQPLGTYRLEAQPIDGPDSSRIGGEFRVAEFKPPNFKVDLKLDKTSAKPGDTITAQAQSNYLFGPPIDGGKVRYSVTREKANLSLENWDGFSVGRQWFWPEEEPTVPSDVSQTSLSLDAKGQASQSIAIAPDLPYPMTYRIDADVSDISNLAVSQSQTLTALPSDRLIGLKVPFVGNAKEPVAVQVIVTDIKGQPIGNQEVHLDLQRMDYSSVTQVIEGSQTTKPQITYKTLAQANVRSANQPQSVTITPPEAGSYRLRASLGSSAATPATEASATDTQLWVSGDNGIDWGSRYDRDRLQLQLDKQTYTPGDIAHVMIQSPYPKGELYLAVVRQGILTKTLTQVQGAAPQIDVPITADMGPNAAIEAILIRQGPGLNEGKLPELDSLVQIGFAPFKLNLDRHYLKVQVTPTQPELGPSQTAIVDLTISDPTGKPVAGQITLLAVNEAVLQLTGHRPPDLVKTVYAEQPIALRFSDNRSQVVLKPLSSPIDKGWGFGGGLSGGLGNNRIRKDFKPLAYYGTIVTNAQGKVQARIALPDDLTTWRILAVATDGNLHFGNGEATVITRQPLMVNPLLPQFLRVGDRVEAGISVTNGSGQSGQIAIEGTIDGALSADKPIALQTQAPGNTAAYRFPLTATTPGTAKLSFGATLNQDQDRIAVPLSVTALTSTEQVIETGATDRSTDIPLNLSDRSDPSVGGLDLSLASNPIPSLKAPLRDSLSSDWPFLETASSQLRIAAELQQLSAIDRQSLAEFNPGEQAQLALGQLKPLQRADGGFAIAPDIEQSDPRLSAYAAQAIGRAQAAQFDISAIQLTPLKTYLQKTLANPTSHSFCKEQPCINQLRLQSLIGLDALGDRRGDFLSDLYGQRAELDAIDQIRLARYLSQFPDWQTEAKAMSEQVRKTINERGRFAKINLPQSQRWFNSTTSAQAEALQLLTAQKVAPAEIAKLVQGLLDLRKNGSWGNSYDNAQALSALVKVSQQSTPPNFTATATLNNQSLLTGQFKGMQSPTVETTIPIAKLPKGKQTLKVQKTGSGMLHYLAAYRYRPIDNPAGRFNGLRVSRSIQPVNTQEASKEKLEPIVRMDLSPIKGNPEVKAGQVLEVTVELITDHPVDHLLLTDPLPAGFEAIDPGIKTTAENESQSVSWQLRTPLIYSDRVTTWGEHLEAGIYQLKYLVRSVTPGNYLYPGVEAKLQYAEEEFGRSTSTRIQVSGL